MLPSRKATVGAPQPQISWKAVFRSQELDILLLGLGCAMALVIWIAYLEFGDRSKAAQMMTAIGAHLMLGRAAGVSTASVSGQLSRPEIIVLGSLVEGMVVCLFFSAFCLSCKKLIHIPWLDSAVRNVRASARKQRRRLLGWGIPGLILFVWFPFLMTGPVVGSVIGYLLGMRPWVVVTTVMFGTTSAIISWTFLMGALNGWVERIGPWVPAVLVLIILTVIVAVRLRSYQRANALARKRRTTAASYPLRPASDAAVDPAAVKARENP